MKSIIKFVRSNIVLDASLAAAVISMFFVPPDMGYLGYVDWSVIILLFCLMAVIAGLRSLGVFSVLSGALLRKTGSCRMVAFILMNLCFFISMLVTNDVALITFVPLTLGLYSAEKGHRNLITTVVIETAAANLGSMLTPIGNPQNLFLYRHYDMDFGTFAGIMLPLGAAAYVLLCACIFLVGKSRIEVSTEKTEFTLSWRLWLYLAVFVLCVLAVGGIVSEYVCLAVTVAAVAAADYKLFARIDYALLATFICFFVFVGNIARISAVEQAVAAVMTGRELLVSAALSQIISNVPAAAMLAGFTENAAGLMRGVNIGGLGTPVASLASLISFRFYSAAENSRKGRYMAVFLGVNFALLAVMLVIGVLLP